MTRLLYRLLTWLRRHQIEVEIFEPRYWRFSARRWMDQIQIHVGPVGLYLYTRYTPIPPLRGPTRWWRLLTRLRERLCPVQARLDRYVGD